MKKQNKDNQPTAQQLKQLVESGQNLQPNKKNHEPFSEITKKKDEKEVINNQLWKRLEEHNNTINNLQKEVKEKNDIIEAITFQTLLTKAYYNQLEQQLQLNNNLKNKLNNIQNITE